MRLSLRARLILSFLAVIAATAGLVVVLANRITADRFTYLVSTTGQMRAHNLAPLFADYLTQAGSWDGVEALMDSTIEPAAAIPGQGRRGRMMGIRGAEDPAGNPWPPTGMRSMMGMMASDGERLLLADAAGQIVADSLGQDAGARLTDADLDKGAPIIVGEQQMGTLIVASGLGTLTPDQNAFLSQVKWLMVVAAVVAGLAVLLVGSFQARRIVAPVRALADAARRVAGGEFAQVPVTSQDELGEMALAFNTMASALKQQHALRRRVMADIAHELRTPLSVLQIDLESIEDGLAEPTPEVVSRLQEEVALLNRLVEDSAHALPGRGRRAATGGPTGGCEPPGAFGCGAGARGGPGEGGQLDGRSPRGFARRGRRRATPVPGAVQPTVQRPAPYTKRGRNRRRCPAG